VKRAEAETEAGLVYQRDYLSQVLQIDAECCSFVSGLPILSQAVMIV